MVARIGLVLLSLLVGGGLPGASAGEEPAPPRIEIFAEPSNAVLHQQVRLLVRVTHPVWARPSWIPPPFEGFWTERLSSVGEPMERDAQGRAVRTTVYRRALFPTRTGSLEIPASQIRYRDSQQELHEVAVPASRVVVSSLPEPGRPEGFSGVVGSPSVETYLSQTEVGTGRGVRLVLDYFGIANVWDAPLPDLQTLLGDDVEVFAEPPRLSLGESQGQLTARRTLRFDLVPRRRGSYEVPSFELAYFDPEAGRYQVARSEAVPFQVVHAPRRANPFEGGRERRGPALRLPWEPFALVVGGILLAVSLSLIRWWRGQSQPRGGAPLPSPRASFESACDAIGSTELPARLAAAVKTGVHVRHHCDAVPLTTEEIADRVDDPVAIELLRTLDRARFAGGIDNPEALVSRVREYLRL